MLSDVFGPEPEDATPLSDEDLSGLIPKSIATRSDLNWAEAQNIRNCVRKYSVMEVHLPDLLDDLFIRSLHREMFSEVWDWAGKYRLVETSIGADPIQISQLVINLVGDAKLWLTTTDPIEIDESIARLHHRLVAIHPFRNGNGRLCRFYADLLLLASKREPFNWTGGLSIQPAKARAAYISALRAADQGNYSPLFKFVKTGSFNAGDAAAGR